MPAPFNVNGWEFVVLAVLFLLLFGPEKLPEIAMQAGRLFRELREAAEAATGELSRELKQAADEHRDTTADVREVGEKASRLLKDRSGFVRDTIRSQFREVEDEIGSIGREAEVEVEVEATPGSEPSAAAEGATAGSAASEEAAEARSEGQERSS